MASALDVLDPAHFDEETITCKGAPDAKVDHRTKRVVRAVRARLKILGSAERGATPPLAIACDELTPDGRCGSKGGKEAPPCEHRTAKAQRDFGANGLHTVYIKFFELGALQRADITRIGDLLSSSEEELRAIFEGKPDSLKDVLEIVEALGGFRK